MFIFLLFFFFSSFFSHVIIGISNLRKSDVKVPFCTKKKKKKKNILTLYFLYRYFV